MEPRTVREWRERWSRKHVAEWLRRAATGRGLEDLAFGEVGGRLDFRGLTAGLEMGALRVARLEGLDLADADLSGCRLELAFVERCAIRRCSFDLADIGALASTASDWVGCSFRGARAAIGFGDSLWGDTSFEDADLRGSCATSADFVRCDFARARFEGPVDLGASRLVRCRFAGRVKELVVSRRPAAGLRPGALHEVDFSEALLEDVGFYGLDLTTCTPPDAADHVVLRRFSEFVEEMASREVPFDLRLQLAAAAATLEPDQRVGLITLADSQGRFDAATRASIREITAAWEAGAGA